ncbi:MAG: hypothetical protein PSX80_09105 [bacterium]|nr:hypothetical protein [bacterium]
MAQHFIARADAESDLLACATYLAESIESSDGHAEGISAVVPRYLDKGDVDLAAELANTVEDPFMRDRLLTLVAEKCAAIGDDEYAMQLVDAIEDLGMQAEGRERIGILEASKGNFDAARQIAESMSHPDHVYAAVAGKMFVDGDTAASKQEVEQIEFASARVSAYTGIVHSRIAEGNIEGLSDLLDAAVSDAVEIEHDEERIRGLVEIGTLYGEVSNNGKAIETLDKARDYAEQLDNVHRDTFLASVSVGFLRAGSQDLADRTLDLVEDKTQLATCLVGHARHFWSKDLKDDAIESIEEAYTILKSQKDNETRNSKEKYRLFGSIAAQFANFGRGERAVETAEAIAEETERMHALSQIAVIFASKGEETVATQAINAIEEDAQRTFALIGVSDAVEKAGNRDAATAHLDEADHLAESVPQLASRSNGYFEIAKRYAQYDQAEKFDSSIAKGIEAVSAIRDESIKVTSLVELDSMVEELKLDIAPEDLGFLKAILKDVPND